MARFRYRMQSILDIKLKMETQAKQEFAAAQLRLNEEEERLAALRERRDGYERQTREQLMGVLNCRDMAENKEALLRMDEYIALQHIRIRKAEEKVEQARAKLVTLMVSGRRKRLLLKQYRGMELKSDGETGRSQAGGSEGRDGSDKERKKTAEE